eukprot:TRINITY_DN53370_c0_g1_i1.p1 TRINITY_DN53370_c0_g1~~TRINITY_DN53370_c0_g1_i1.p1  ORF type:complete len:230 (-),score=38.89 TRINITY_DN53370_c0_g1_i1:96-785(-)
MAHVLNSLWKEVADVVVDTNQQDGAVEDVTLMVDVDEVMAGDLEEVRLADGRESTVRVLAIDTISAHPRARVQFVDSEEVLVVRITPKLKGRHSTQSETATVASTSSSNLENSNFQSSLRGFSQSIFQVVSRIAFGTGRAPSAAADTSQDLESGTQISPDSQTSTSQSHSSLRGWLFGTFRRECQATVDDFQKKGAVGTVREAATDVAGMVQTTFLGAFRLLWRRPQLR